jgi:FkbM family methyltransferase
MHNGFFIDIGCYDGITNNYTYHLENQYNWTGICIDANTDILATTINNRPKSRCISSVVWSSNSYLDFEKEINNPLSGRIYNISHNNNYSNLITKELTSVNTIYKILIDNKIILPETIDCIILDINGAEIYVLEYLFTKFPPIFSSVIINYRHKFSYLQQLIKLTKELSQWSIESIDETYLKISKKSNLNNKIWISDRGLFSLKDKNLWYGYLDSKTLEPLQEVDINEHCISLSNSEDLYRICNRELYKIDINNAYLKITDGQWTS